MIFKKSNGVSVEVKTGNLIVYKDKSGKKKIGKVDESEEKFCDLLDSDQFDLKLDPDSYQQVKNVELTDVVSTQQDLSKLVVELAGQIRVAANYIMFLQTTTF